jgi:hypothetical protein
MSAQPMSPRRQGPPTHTHPIPSPCRLALARGRRPPAPAPSHLRPGAQPCRLTAVVGRRSPSRPALAQRRSAPTPSPSPQPGKADAVPRRRQASQHSAVCRARSLAPGCRLLARVRCAALARCVLELDCAGVSALWPT